MTEHRYDVVILGGAFSGSAAAVLLRRENPSLKVLVIEKLEKFDEKVGEATTEMSGMFLTRRLALWQHLERNHLPKEGLRYWFSNESVTGHADASESGSFYRSAVPSFQLRRDVLDEHLLVTAEAEGADVWRPVQVKDVEIGSFDHTVIVEREGRKERVRCRWVLDATGRSTLLARRLRLLKRNEEHPIAAMWCRWRNVRHVDDIAARGPEGLAQRNIASRRLATNHYMGRGYWIWVIPLGSGETSIGIVFDKRLVDLHLSREREADYTAFLRAIPALGELLDGANHRSDDLRSFGHLPYWSEKYMGDGWALLGDSAVFIDPYYSPGLDHAAFSVEATTMLVLEEMSGKDISSKVDEHNETFLRSNRRFFRSIYKDKYYFMGEHDLVSASFLLDTGHYYIFVVVPAYRVFGKFFWMPVLGPKPAFFSYHLMRIYNARFTKLAELRRRAGEAGRRNAGRRINAYFNLSLAPFRMVARGLGIWALAELDGVRLRMKVLFGGEAKPVESSTGTASTSPGLER